MKCTKLVMDKIDEKPQRLNLPNQEQTLALHLCTDIMFLKLKTILLFTRCLQPHDLVRRGANMVYSLNVTAPELVLSPLCLVCTKVLSVKVVN